MHLLLKTEDMQEFEILITCCTIFVKLFYVSYMLIIYAKFVFYMVAILNLRWRLNCIIYKLGDRIQNMGIATLFVHKLSQTRRQNIIRNGGQIWLKQIRYSKVCDLQKKHVSKLTNKAIKSMFARTSSLNTNELGQIHMLGI